jgi:hypothetical protein
MDKNDIANSIIYLPEKFYRQRDVSMYFLLRESGYFEMYDQISEKNIFDELTKNPECVGQWLNWSEDKRSSSGWYFKQNENKFYIVGYFPPQDNLKDRNYFDITEACAAFIKQEIEAIRKN